MRAALIKAFGEPTEVLELANVPEPLGPAAGEVLVGVEYAPVNMNDLYVIQGAFPVRRSLPSIVGNEGVGRVLAVGGGVEHLTVGDRVLVPLYAFSWRERLVVPSFRKRQVSMGVGAGRRRAERQKISRLPSSRRTSMGTSSQNAPGGGCDRGNQTAGRKLDTNCNRPTESIR
jgi:NADPH:quinone reductase-like Zn-dependent oxidoreductase